MGYLWKIKTRGWSKIDARNDGNYGRNRIAEVSDDYTVEYPQIYYQLQLERSLQTPHAVDSQADAIHSHTKRLRLNQHPNPLPVYPTI